MNDSHPNLNRSFFVVTGDDISIEIKGVTNNRRYKSAAEIICIYPPHFAKVRYKQPWGRRDNGWRETIVDLRISKKIKRRIKS